MIAKYLLLLLGNIVINVIAQLQLKSGMNKADIKGFKEETLFSMFKKMFFNFNVWIGGSLYVISLLIWMVVLTKLELSFAYPAISATYFFVALFSKFIFNEKVSKARWAAIFVIIFGILIMSIGSF